MLTLEGITAGYGPATVLRDVDLTVPASSVVALLGPNGAGKTTLLRVTSGLLAPWAGRVLLEGTEVTGLSPDGLARRGVCHVPEGRGVFPPLSVRENLALFSPPGGEQAGLDRALEAFPDLAGRLDQTAGTMSGGQQQMLALARAYVAGARVILLDEVSMGLAPIVVDQIFEFLHRVAGEGVSLLLVEQYVNKALAIADYAYILARGRISFAGDAAELADEDVFARYLGIEVAADAPLAGPGRPRV
ncbi:MAG TPA: ABC transporter ATP-binding protein [Acidimicrobiia bacterium]|nr:ABC transporter ATP-binding protein [Acidimicrobiia bacterium]